MGIMFFTSCTQKFLMPHSMSNNTSASNKGMCRALSARLRVPNIARNAMPILMNSTNLRACCLL